MPASRMPSLHLLWYCRCRRRHAAANSCLVVVLVCIGKQLGRAGVAVRVPGQAPRAPRTRGALVAQLQGVDAEGLRAIDLELRAGAVALLLGPSGAGKSSLLRLLAGGSPTAAVVFDVSALPRPLPVLDAVALGSPAPMIQAVCAEAFETNWREKTCIPHTRTSKWKAHCFVELERQRQHCRQDEVNVLSAPLQRLLLLDEALDNLPRPLRTRFAADLRAAARAVGFAVVSSTHCLAGDVRWISEAADDVLILENGRLRQTLCPGEPADMYALQSYAALRCRLGTTNA